MMTDAMRPRVGLAIVAAVVVALLCGVGAPPRLHAADTLDIYCIDTGASVGNATLIVTPAGESMLIDSGPPYAAKHVLSVMKTQAGLKQLDFLVTTHYHADHFAATEAVAKGMPIKTFVDHGESVEVSKSDDWWKERRAPWFREGMGKQYDLMYERYVKARAAGTHQVVRPGDTIAIKGAEVTVLCSGGKVLDKPLPGAGAPGTVCAEVERRTDDDCEDAQSIGTLVAFGPFRFVYLGDLTWNIANDLFCPRNLVGPVDAYVVTHHAQSFPLSMGAYYHGLSACPKSELDGLRPRVAILSLGSHGHRQGTPDAIATVRASAGLEDLWQTERVSSGGEKEHNAPASFIANIDGPEGGPQTRFIKLSARRDGSFTVTNSRNGYSKTYPPRSSVK